MGYGQFCPVAKAMEILGEKWTLLIVRELLMGATRFNELQRGLSQISPTILSKRLAMLEQQDLLVRKRISGQRGYEYYLTESGRELLAVVDQVGTWGMRWARGRMADAELDMDLLMLYLQRSIRPERLPGYQAVVRFHFTDMADYADWWILAEDGQVELCTQDPGREVDVYFTTDLRTMVEVWMGDVSYRRAIADGRLKLVGPKALTRNVGSWMVNAHFAGIPPARSI